MSKKYSNSEIMSGAVAVAAALIKLIQNLYIPEETAGTMVAGGRNSPAASVVSAIFAGILVWILMRAFFCLVKLIRNKKWQGRSKEEALLEAVRKEIYEKCNRGSDLSVLTPEEKTVYMLDTFLMEINNGGFDQYLYNSSGAFLEMLVDSLRVIGAEHTAEICRKVRELLPDELPATLEERRIRLSQILDENTRQKLEIFDRQIYDDVENLEACMHRFVVENNVVFAHMQK